MAKSKKPKRLKPLPNTQPAHLKKGPAPILGGPKEIFKTERASASPVQPKSEVKAPKTPSQKAETAQVVEGPLSTLQAWLSAVATHPKSVAEGIAQGAELQKELGASQIEQLITPSATLTAAQRLELYHYAYHARLVGCLEDDYPVVKYALGEDRFEFLCRAYIEAHPSTDPNLNFFGKHFSAFAQTQGVWLPEYAFVSNLAGLEWAMVEVLHAKGAETLSLVQLQQEDPSHWPDIRFDAANTLRLLEFDYPVNAFLQAAREDLAPKIPSAKKSSTAVYRQDFHVWRMDCSKAMGQTLKHLIDGATLGEALGGLEGSAEETDVMVWFKEWVEGGFFAAIQLPKSAPPPS